MRLGSSHLKWHPSHRFFPNDDILECDQCGCRTYSAESKKKCVPFDVPCTCGCGSIACSNPKGAARA